MIPRGRKIAFALLAAIILVLVGGRVVAEFSEDLLWYQMLALDRVFWTRWLVATGVRLVLGSIFAIVLFVNLSIVARTLGTIRVRRRYANIEIAERLPHGYVVAALVIVSIISGWWLSAGISNPMGLLAAFRHASWGLRDPFFGLDASFYVFVLPVLEQLQLLSGLLVAWTAIIVVSSYATTGALKLVDGRLQVSEVVRRHMGVLAAVFLLIVAWDLWLDRYGLVVAGAGVGGAIGYTDVHARLPGMLIMVGVALGAAAAVGLGMWRNQRNLALVGLGLLAIGSVLSTLAIPAMMQKLVVEPNEIVREQPYIQRHIDFTRYAYQLDEIEPVTFPYRSSPTPGSAEVLDAVAGAPLWDPRPLRTTFNVKESLRQYYTFASVHADRYAGEQVAVSVRELDPEGLTAPTWQNLHLNYVSGQAAVVTRMAAMAADGSPEYLLRDLEPPKLAPLAPPDLGLTSPDVYFGERTSGYVVVEPDARPNGVPLSSLWRKLVFAWAFQSRNLMLSSSVTPGSKVVYRRNVVERVMHAAPFLRLLPERGTLPVIYEGRIVWMIDGFTTSESFPLARRASFEGLPVRYVRNSVKATVDAITGEVQIFAVEPNDPVLQTYAAFFPGLVQPMDEMPEGLREHLRFPAPLLDLQSAVLGEYHVRDPGRFYARADVWTAATETYRSEQEQVGSSYVMLRLPGQSEREFLLTVPLSALGRPNLAAFLVARNDPPFYGRRILYELPRAEQVPGPQQIEAQIDQNPEISQQLSLWKDGGSQVIRGRLLIIPLDSTLIFLEPLFLEADQTATPQLERVILATPHSVVMRSTLEAAVNALLSDNADVVTGSQSGSDMEGSGLSPASRELILRSRELAARAEAELRAGDLAAFGATWQALRQLLESTPMEAEP